MTIKVKGFGSFGYTESSIESPKLYGFKSKVTGLLISRWSNGTYYFIVKVLKLD